MELANLLVAIIGILVAIVIGILTIKRKGDEARKISQGNLEILLQIQTELLEQLERYNKLSEEKIKKLFPIY